MTVQDLLRQDQFARERFYEALKSGRVSEASRLIDRGLDLSKDGSRAAYLIAGTGDCDLMRKAVALGANPRTQMDLPFLRASTAGRFEMLQLLIETYGVAVDARDGQALLTAVASGRFDLVDYLLERGADPNRRNYAAFRECFVAYHQQKKIAFWMVVKLFEAGGDLSSAAKSSSCPPKLQSFAKLAEACLRLGLRRSEVLEISNYRHAASSVLLGLVTSAAEARQLLQSVPQKPKLPYRL